jgi:hypothetical protein
VLRGGDETVEGLFGLFHAFLRERAHFRRDLEIPIAFLRHDILLPVVHRRPPPTLTFI